MSLYLLFFDSLDATTPKISAQTRPVYEEFVKTMRAVYQEESKRSNVNVNMKKIKNTVNPTLCKSSGPLYISDKAAVDALRKSAGEPSAKQLQHTAKVMTILKKLFIISPSETYPSPAHYRIGRYGCG
jgi:hypothetical protein